MRIFCLTFLITLWSPVRLQETIKIIFLKENGQDQVVDWLQTTLKTPENNLILIPIIVELQGQEDDTNKICASLSEGGTFIIDVTWSGNDEALKMAAEMSIPYIQIDVSISSMLLLLDKYLEYRNSTDVAVIFDNQNKVDEALYFWIDTTLLRMVFAENLDTTSASRFRNIHPSPNNYAIVASTENMTRLLKKAWEENLVMLPERWNLLFLDFRYKDFDKKLLRELPINMLYLNEEVCCNLLKKDKSCECPQNFNLEETFFKLALAALKEVLSKMLDSKLGFTKNIECDKKNYNKETNEQFNSLLQAKIETYDFMILENSVKIILKANGSVELGSKNITDLIAQYNTQNGVTPVKGQEIRSIKAFYRIGITHALPWSYKVKDRKGVTKWTGYCVDFAEEISKIMNFDYEFFEPESGDFGRKINGRWDGVVGDLERGETDLAITALIMTADREEVIDFVAPYFEQTGITIVMRKPVRKTSLFKFMTVLKLEVWLSIVGALIVTGFMVWFLDKYSPYSARNNKKAYPYPCREFTLKESFWFALTSFTPQGGGEAPKALSGRTLVAAYWLFVVLMLATFTANLAAFLTVERMQTPVQSLEQLAKQSRINYTVVKESNTHMYFINMKNAEDTLYRMWKELTLNASTDDTRYRVWDYPIREQYGHILLAINDSNPLINASEGFRIVDEHTDADFAFIHDSSEIKYEISLNCNLTEVGEVFAERPYAIAVQQGSHLQDEISKTILQLQKERFFEHLQAKYWNHSTKGNCPSTDDNEGITLESLGGVFIATLFGLALAMITLVGEVLYYRRKRKNKEKISGENFENRLKKAKTISDAPVVKGNILTVGDPVTIGTEFKPVNFKNKQISDLAHITLYPRPRNRITQINE